MNEKLGSRIKALRIAKNFTQEQVADQIGVSRQKYARIESGVTPDETLAFGDNLNDIPMFELADECYATSNAVEKVKCISTDVIGSC